MTLTDSICRQHQLASFEGDRGVENLNDLAQVLGYSGHGFRFGSPLECFLSDNPGAQQALLEWIDANDSPWEDVKAEYSDDGHPDE